MKISTWSPLALALSAAFPASADILITEYVEGSSNNKTIELTNTGSTDASLTGLRLRIASNGSTSFGSTVNLSGSLAAGASYVVANSSASSEVLDVAQQTSGAINFNGNDVVALVDDNDNVLDGIGQLGNGDTFGANVTLRRLDGSAARTDLSTSFTPSDEWQSFASNTFDGLGCSGVEACDGGGGGNTFSCEGETLTPTYAIQGSGDRSPLVPDGSFEAEGTYYVEGVVTAVTTSLYKASGCKMRRGTGIQPPPMACLSLLAPRQRALNQACKCV
ncbi:lamin tail domain-containing protein [Enterovibrio coralii]|uniref:lamin tail domain-containing protein n=1 Tax=Enterovibrio coralii TaxID=294935 RepID=UPI000AF024EB|nr:lamin tail domain-containing protein [Enterovibrio coralii]